ncbi:hypothetical protein BLNAU_23411 [Blattamonas nauphoetae]|uniref:Uncharacterized protein n=1 Tax=Blattamonas nauphoetae TaxID=2049346 RepID=A0ABQ9WSH2_9EUKA|nr:hypothetical protein BLNAU_23411 [Blattamonas nauphoetae]
MDDLASSKLIVVLPSTLSSAFCRNLCPPVQPRQHHPIIRECSFSTILPHMTAEGSRFRVHPNSHLQVLSPTQNSIQSVNVQADNLDNGFSSPPLRLLITPHLTLDVMEVCQNVSFRPIFDVTVTACTYTSCSTTSDTTSLASSPYRTLSDTVHPHWNSSHHNMHVTVNVISRRTPLCENSDRGWFLHLHPRLCLS